MAKISEIEVPSLLLDEQASDPATPAAGFGRLYAKSDGLYFVDDAGSVVGPLGAAGSAANLASGKVERNNQVSNLTIASATWADMDSTNLTIDLTTGARRVLLMLSLRISQTNTANTVAFGFSVDGTAKYDLNGLIASRLDGSTANISHPMMLSWVTDVLTAGAHTFRPRWARLGGTGTINAHQQASDHIVFSAVELLAA